MAAGFLVCVAPDSHISYLKDHPGLAHAYVDGAAPSDADLSEPLPPWWPESAPQRHDRWSVNYRNADLYHWMLNHSSALTTGAGAIFQTWYEPDHAPMVIKLDDHNERFGLYADHIDELLRLAATVSMSTVHDDFVGWLKSQNKEYDDIDHYACEPFFNEFDRLQKLLRVAIDGKSGIIW